VALGDSFTAAPLEHQQGGGSAAACLRSQQDYPALVAAALHPSSFVNVSCFGASTTDMTQAQRIATGVAPPQLAAVSAADTLVTLQVGGDDIGVGRIAVTCAALSLTSPFGSPCRQHYTAGGTDQLARAIAQTGPKVASVLGAIRDQAPHARILVVGYPDILPVSGNGCWPEVAVARGDVPYLRGIETLLNAMLASEAAARQHVRAQCRARRLPARRDQMGGGPDPDLACRSVPPERPGRAGHGPGNSARPAVSAHQGSVSTVLNGARHGPSPDREPVRCTAPTRPVS
jgi:hypothetical protein